MVETEQFKKIYDATYDRVLSYVFMKCGKIETVEDIMQEIYTEFFLVLLQKGINYIKKPESFIMQLAKSKVHQYYSEKERQKLYTYVDGLEMVEKEALLQGGRSDTQELEDYLVDYLTAQEVMEYISCKDELTKEIFYQHYFKDITLKEIAENCGVKESTVKNRLYRTLKELHKMKLLICIILLLLLTCLLVKPAYSFAQDIFSQIKSFFTGEKEKLLDDLVYWDYAGKAIELEAGEEIKISALPGMNHPNVAICMLGSEYMESAGMITRDIKYYFEASISGVYIIVAVNEEGKTENITEELAIVKVFDEEKETTQQPEWLLD